MAKNVGEGHTRSPECSLELENIQVDNSDASITVQIPFAIAIPMD